MMQKRLELTLMRWWAINQVMNLLSETDRAIVQMSLDGAGFREIAKKVGFTQARVQQRQDRLWERLEAALFGADFSSMSSYGVPK